MPDVGALQKGKLEIVICTGTGFQTLSLDENGNPLPADNSTPTDHIDKFKCPFGGAAFKPVAMPAVLFVAAPVLARPPVGQATAAAVRRAQFTGPVLGPRAPPAFLG